MALISENVSEMFFQHMLLTRLLSQIVAGPLWFVIYLSYFSGEEINHANVWWIFEWRLIYIRVKFICACLHAWDSSMYSVGLFLGEILSFPFAEWSRLRDTKVVYFGYFQNISLGLVHKGIETILWGILFSISALL